MSKINKKGVELIGIINRVGNNAIVECKCPICNNTFTMYRSHFYRGSNACKCKSPKNDRIYSIWINMKTRCYNNNSPNSKYYLNKGITVCESWLNSYKNFENWALSNGYSDDLSIDRIDNLKGYYPDNCRWVSSFIQNKNKSNNVYIKIEDTNLTLKDWSRHLNISYKTLTSYYYRNGKDKLIQYINRKIKHLDQ